MVYTDGTSLPMYAATMTYHILCRLLCIADMLTTEEIMPSVPEKRPDAAFPGLKVSLPPATKPGAQTLGVSINLQHIPYT